MSNVIHVTLKNISKKTAEKYILEKKDDFKSYDDYILNFAKKISPPDGNYTREWLKKNWGSGSNGYDCKVKSGRDDTLIIDFNCNIAPPIEIIEKMKDECDFELSSYSVEDFEARQITFINGVDRKTLVWNYDIKGEEYVVKSLRVEVKDDNYHTIYCKRHSKYSEKKHDDE